MTKLGVSRNFRQRLDGSTLVKAIKAFRPLFLLFFTLSLFPDFSFISDAASFITFHLGRDYFHH